VYITRSKRKTNATRKGIDFTSVFFGCMVVASTLELPCFVLSRLDPKGTRAREYEMFWDVLRAESWCLGLTMNDWEILFYGLGGGDAFYLSELMGF
jgi:hypothetical protein